jgi:RNA polymerase sigma-70 factor
MRIEPALDDVISSSLAEAVAFHGDLGLAAEKWRLRILTILRKWGKNPSDAVACRFVERLHRRDLYLATGCAEHLDPAWRRFDASYKRQIADLVRCAARNPLQASEVGDGLIVDLFLPDRSGHSRIGSYDGRSSLATWLHVVVTHRLANERMRKWNSLERPGDIPEQADSTSVREVEASLRAKRYEAAVDEALRKACEALTPRDREILLLRYEHGLLLVDIGRLLSVHPSTVCRQIERLLTHVRTTVISILSTRYGLSASAIDECLHDVSENRSCSVSLLRLISNSIADPAGANERRRHAQIL